MECPHNGKTECNGPAEGERFWECPILGRRLTKRRTRRCRERPDYYALYSGQRFPSITRRARNYGSALKRWHAAGRPVRSDEEVERLFETHCRPCPRYDSKRQACQYCGCRAVPQDIGYSRGELWKKLGAMANKLRMATENCPMGRWGKRVVEFITTDSLVADTMALIPEVADVDVIVGIARSGMIPASILATMLHRPLYSVAGRCSGGRCGASIQACGQGSRLRQRIEQRILLIDDSTFRGNTMRRFAPAVARHWPQAEVIRAAIYVTPETRYVVDIAGRLFGPPHWFEWHFFNSPHVASAAFDFDGVLCDDIAPEDDDDGVRYLEAIRQARPKYPVRHTTIPLVVTARLEKYRDETAAWCRRHGIQIDRLVMGSWETLQHRTTQGVIQFKAEEYQKAKLKLFVESCPKQAAAIARLSGKRVLCPAAGRVF